MGAEDGAALADPVRASLLGPHRGFALGAEGAGAGALRYPPRMSPFAAFVQPGAWDALRALPGEVMALVASGALDVPDGWTVLRELRVLQLTGAGAVVPGDDDHEVVALGEADVEAMVDLAERTRPGPFDVQTIAFGGYVGIRREGKLMAMAGRRMHPPGWIEVSAVCADPPARGQGLGRRVTEAVIRGIRADGAQPFLHVVPENPALRLYEALGFVVARELRVTAVGPAAAT